VSDLAHRPSRDDEVRGWWFRIGVDAEGRLLVGPEACDLVRFDDEGEERALADVVRAAVCRYGCPLPPFPKQEQEP
jgi:hypothetical protein